MYCNVVFTPFLRSRIIIRFFNIFILLVFRVRKVGTCCASCIYIYLTFKPYYNDIPTITRDTGRTDCRVYIFVVRSSNTNNPNTYYSIMWQSVHIMCVIKTQFFFFSLCQNIICFLLFVLRRAALTIIALTRDWNHAQTAAAVETWYLPIYDVYRYILVRRAYIHNIPGI